MSNKRRKSVQRSSAYAHGPSRPVDLRNASGRNAPGRYQRGYQPGYRRGGLPPFAIGMMSVVGIAALVFVIFFLVQNSGNASNAGAPASSGQDTNNAAVPSMTQTMIAFSTQTAPDILPRITIQEAKALYDAGNIKFIDVRPKSLTTAPYGYDQGHIKGAVSVPQKEVLTRVKDLPREGNLVLYCDCPHDEESAGTAYTLKSGGYTNMKVLQGPQAYTEWKNLGYPVEP